MHINKDNQLKIVYARQKIDKSIFLAGPTPRKHTTTPSWRPGAIEFLRILNFRGQVFVPEDAPTTKTNWTLEYDHQIKWEWEALNQATCVVFWIPRDIEQMPGFTTNVEFGLFAHSSKVLLGYPEGAAKMGYVEALAGRYNIPIHRTLPQLLIAAIHKIHDPYTNTVDHE